MGLPVYPWQNTLNRLCAALDPVSGGSCTCPSPWTPGPSSRQALSLALPRPRMWTVSLAGHGTVPQSPDDATPTGFRSAAHRTPPGRSRNFRRQEGGGAQVLHHLLCALPVLDGLVQAPSVGAAHVVAGLPDDPRQGKDARPSLRRIQEVRRHPLRDTAGPEDPDVQDGARQVGRRAPHRSLPAAQRCPAAPPELCPAVLTSAPPRPVGRVLGFWAAPPSGAPGPARPPL